MGGGSEGNLRAYEALLHAAVSTTISLLRPMANNRISKSPPHSVGLRTACFLSNHCIVDKPSSKRTAG